VCPRGASRNWTGRKGSEHRFDLRPEDGKIVLRCVVDDVPVHPEIIVDQNVSHSHDLLPGYLRMAVLQLFGQTPRGFADDLDVAQEVRLQRRIAVKSSAVRGEILPYRFNGVENVLKLQAIGPHSDTASLRTISPNLPSSAPSEITSTFTPTNSRRSMSRPP